MAHLRAFSEDFKMTDLYEKGTVIELEREGKRDILVYRKYDLFLYLFTNITPDSKKFGAPVIWDSNTKYFQTAVKSARKIGQLNDRQIEKILGNPNRAKKLLENLLKQK